MESGGGGAVRIRSDTKSGGRQSTSGPIRKVGGGGGGGGGGPMPFFGAQKIRYRL